MWAYAMMKQCDPTVVLPRSTVPRLSVAGRGAADLSVSAGEFHSDRMIANMAASVGSRPTCHVVVEDFEARAECLQSFGDKISGEQLDFYPTLTTISILDAALHLSVGLREPLKSMWFDLLRDAQRHPHLTVCILVSIGDEDHFPEQRLSFLRPTLQEFLAGEKRQVSDVNARLMSP